MQRPLTGCTGGGGRGRQNHGGGGRGGGGGGCGLRGFDIACRTIKWYLQCHSVNISSLAEIHGEASRPELSTP